MPIASAVAAAADGNVGLAPGEVGNTLAHQHLHGDARMQVMEALDEA